MHFCVCRFREKEVILQKKNFEDLLRAKHCARCWEPKIYGHLRIMRCWLREGLVHNYLLSVYCTVEHIDYITLLCYIIQMRSGRLREGILPSV